MVLSWYSTTTIYVNVSTNSLPWKNGLFHQTSVKNGCLEFQVVPKFLKKAHAFQIQNGFVSMKFQWCCWKLKNFQMNNWAVKKQPGWDGLGCMADKTLVV